MKKAGDIISGLIIAFIALTFFVSFWKETLFFLGAGLLSAAMVKVLFSGMSEIARSTDDFLYWAENFIEKLKNRP